MRREPKELTPHDRTELRLEKWYRLCYRVSCKGLAGLIPWCAVALLLREVCDPLAKGMLAAACVINPAAIIGMLVLRSKVWKHLDLPGEARRALNAQMELEEYDPGRGLDKDMVHQVFPPFHYPRIREYIRGKARGRVFESCQVCATTGNDDSQATEECFCGQWITMQGDVPWNANVLVFPRRDVERIWPDKPAGKTTWEYVLLHPQDFAWVFGPGKKDARRRDTEWEALNRHYICCSDNAEALEQILTEARMEGLLRLGREADHRLYFILQKDGTAHALVDSKRTLFDYHPSEQRVNSGFVRNQFREDAAYLARLAGYVAEFLEESTCTHQEASS